MKLKVLAGVMAMSIISSAVDFDFTGKTVPPGVTGVTAKDLRGGNLVCNFDKRYRLQLPEEVAKSSTLTMQVWFAKGEYSRGQNVLLFSRKPVIPDTNLGFFFGFLNTRPEFKWWNVHTGYEGILYRNVRQTYIPHSPTIAMKRWQCVSAVITPQELKLYVNGKPTAVKALSHPITIRGGELNLGIGQFGDREPARYSYPLMGVIGKVSVEAVAKSEAEILADYTQGKKIFRGSPIQEEIEIPEFDPKLKVTLKQTAAYGQDVPPAQPMAQGDIRIKTAHGVPSLFIDGKQEYPMMFMPSPWQDDVMGFPPFRDFAAADFTLNSDMISTNLKVPGLLGTWWEGEGTYDFDRIDRRFQMIVKANPKARVLVRLKMDPPHWWWTVKHPEFMPVFYKNGKFEQYKNWCGLTSKEWQDLYSTMLRDFIRHVESQPYGKHIIGYLPGGGSASEWYYHGQDHGLIDYSPIAQRDFRSWLEKRYGTVAKLNAAWGTSFKAFSESGVPAPEQRLAAEQGVFRDPVSSRPSRDYCRYLNELTIDNVRNTAAIVKEMTGGKKLAGYFYGYMNLARFTSFGSLHNNGHTALGELIKNTQVDFFATPLDYGKRRGKQPGLQIGNFNGTFALHDKLFWDEADYRTHFALNQFSEKCRDADETEGVLRRTFGQMMAKGHAVWWFALVGNHVFHSNRIMEDMKRFMAIGRRDLGRSKASVAQVALVMDEETIPYLSTTQATQAKLYDLLWGTYENANCAGLPADMFLSGDLSNPKMRDYKLYIFANMFYITPEKRQAIHEKLKRNGATAVWLYAPGYVTETGCSLASMKSLTGFEFTKLNAVPDFGVKGPNLTSFNGITSVYSPQALKPAELRKVARQAGIHVYVDGDDMFNVNESFMTLHAATSGAKTFTLPEVYAQVVDVFTNRPVAENTKSFTVQVKAGETVVFRLDKTLSGN